jgi:hypothetical protein
LQKHGKMLAKEVTEGDVAEAHRKYSPVDDLL